MKNSNFWKNTDGRCLTACERLTVSKLKALEGLGNVTASRILKDFYSGNRQNAFEDLQQEVALALLLKNDSLTEFNPYTEGTEEHKKAELDLERLKISFTDYRTLMSRKGKAYTGSREKQTVQNAAGAEVERNKQRNLKNVYIMDEDGNERKEVTATAYNAEGFEHDIDVKTDIEYLKTLLTEKQRLILELRLKGYNITDIAKKMKRNKSTIKRTLDLIKAIYIKNI